MWPEIHGLIPSRRILELLIEDLIVAHSPQIQLQLPNLRCRDVHLDLHRDPDPGGTHQLQIRATIENSGLTRAGACNVEAHILLGSINQTFVLQTRCPALDAGSSIRLEIGTIGGRTQDGTHIFAVNQFANATVILDPPTPMRPGGEVWDSNEQDNICFTSTYLAPPDDPPIDEGPLSGVPEVTKQ